MEAAAAAGLTDSTLIPEEVASHLNDKELVKAAAFINGKWTAQGSKQGATFQVMDHFRDHLL
jgi:hypothetical protein